MNCRLGCALACLITLLVTLGCTSVADAPRPDVQDFVAQNVVATGSDWTELWILDRGSGPPPAGTPTSPGRLHARPANGSPGFEIPVRDLEVDADVIGRLAAVRVKQHFAWQGTAELDLDYELPIPAEAAVTDLLLRFGERTIRAVVRERTDAQRMFAAAQRAGLLATLVTRQPDGTFRQRLGRSPATRGPIEVEVGYVHGIPWNDGWCELDVPAARTSSWPATIQVKIEAGAPIQAVEAPGYRIATAQPEPDHVSATLERANTPTARNTSYTMRWRIDPFTVRGALFVCTDPGGGDPYGLLTMYGPSGFAVDWGGLRPRDVHPKLPGDHAAGTSVTLVGRLQGPTSDVPAGVSARHLRRRGRAIRSAWGQLQIGALAARGRGDIDEAAAQQLEDEVRTTALDHGLTTAVTSLVMVDARSGEASR